MNIQGAGKKKSVNQIYVLVLLHKEKRAKKEAPTSNVERFSAVPASAAAFPHSGLSSPWGLLCRSQRSISAKPAIFFFFFFFLAEHVILCFR